MEAVAKLWIDSLTQDDEAEYMVEAKNGAGIANTWVEVLVESKSLSLVVVLIMYGPE